MANQFEIRKKIENFIELLVASRVDRFYPSALAKYLGISSIEAFSHLLERCGPGDELFLKWEVRCPYCYRTLKITNDKTIDEEIECNCGEEFELQPSDFFPVFQINPEYKKFINDEFKKKRQSSLENPFNDLIGTPQSLETLLPHGVLTKELTKKALRNLESQSPNIIQLTIVKGDVYMEQRKIEGSFNNSDLRGNSAIQADNVSQVQTINQSVFEKAFQDLFSAIKKLQDETIREQAEFNAKLLQEAFEKNDTNKGKMLLKFLKEALGAIAPLTTIASYFGISFK